MIAKREREKGSRKNMADYKYFDVRSKGFNIFQIQIW